MGKETRDGSGVRAGAIQFSPPVAEASSTQLYLAAIVMLLLSLGSGLLAISYLACPSQITLLEPLCNDQHIKYLIPLMIPVTSWFAIANWVGWEFFRYA